VYSQIDRIIFPNLCEVYQITSHQYVYLIFKNASSLLRKKQKQHNWKTFINEQIKKINEIEIYLREPYERYVSGIETYVYEELIINPKLNFLTLVEIATKYLFLDRHFCPQYYWLCNLARYTKKECKFLIKPLNEINKIVDNDFFDPMDSLQDELRKKLDLVPQLPKLKKGPQLDKFLELDRIIIKDFMNKAVTIREINKNFKTNYSELYKDIFMSGNEVANQHGMS